MAKQMTAWELEQERKKREQLKKLLWALDLPSTYKRLAWEHLIKEKDETDEFTRWEVYNALTHAISHYNTEKSVVTRSKYEREVYSVLYDN